MKTTFELNNLRKDADYTSESKITKYSPIVEVFSAMVDGKNIGDLGLGARADAAVNYIKQLGERAENGDFTAVAELNTLRRFKIETPVLDEIKLLSIFGTYQALGYDDSIERVIRKHVGERSREQAGLGDVVFPAIHEERYPVGTTTVSGGYAVDYRRVALGNMEDENEGLAMVKTDIMNKALLYVVDKVYNSIKAATGVKYFLECDAGLVKSSVDGVLTKVRKFGKPTILGEYGFVSQFTPWAGYIGGWTPTGGSAVTIANISERAMNEIAANGIIGSYNGATVKEIPNPYNETEVNADGTNFETYLPAGLGYVLPAGGKSPIATWTRGGLTSFTGNNVANGKIYTRFDLEVAADVAKGQEYKIGVIYDKALGGLD